MNWDGVVYSPMIPANVLKLSRVFVSNTIWTTSLHHPIGRIVSAGEGDFLATFVKGFLECRNSQDSVILEQSEHTLKPGVIRIMLGFGQGEEIFPTPAISISGLPFWFLMLSESVK